MCNCFLCLSRAAVTRARGAASGRHPFVNPIAITHQQLGPASAREFAWSLIALPVAEPSGLWDGHRGLQPSQQQHQPTNTYSAHARPKPTNLVCICQMHGPPNPRTLLGSQGGPDHSRTMLHTSTDEPKASNVAPLPHSGRPPCGAGSRPAPCSACSTLPAATPHVPAWGRLAGASASSPPPSQASE